MCINLPSKISNGNEKLENGIAYREIKSPKREVNGIAINALSIEEKEKGRISISERSFSRISGSEELVESGQILLLSKEQKMNDNELLAQLDDIENSLRKPLSDQKLKDILKKLGEFIIKSRVTLEPDIKIRFCDLLTSAAELMKKPSTTVFTMEEKQELIRSIKLIKKFSPNCNDNLFWKINYTYEALLRLTDDKVILIDFGKSILHFFSAAGELYKANVSSSVDELNKAYKRSKFPIKHKWYFNCSILNKLHKEVIRDNSKITQLTSFIEKHFQSDWKFAYHAINILCELCMRDNCHLNIESFVALINMEKIKNFTVDFKLSPLLNLNAPKIRNPNVNLRNHFEEKLKDLELHASPRIKELLLYKNLKPQELPIIINKNRIISVVGNNQDPSEIDQPIEDLLTKLDLDDRELKDSRLYKEPKKSKIDHRIQEPQAKKESGRYDLEYEDSINSQERNNLEMDQEFDQLLNQLEFEEYSQMHCQELEVDTINQNNCFDQRNKQLKDKRKAVDSHQKQLEKKMKVYPQQEEKWLEVIDNIKKE
ncbi:MAG: hypothetical protein LLG04_18185 [Parachlamydia sp.]|nr:hypothetical protein [Parachlamydia sp.]